MAKMTHPVPLGSIAAVSGPHGFDEARRGEIFLGNFNEDGFALLVAETKRRGTESARGSDGKILKGEMNLFPVYVSDAEYRQARQQYRAAANEKTGV